MAESTAPSAPEKEDPFPQAEPRRDVVGASVNSEEKTAILKALANGGFDNQSSGARQVLLAYTEDAKTRDAVAAAIKRYEIN